VIALPPPPIVSFARLPAGWHQFSEQGGGAYALSWRYRPQRTGWATAMPRNGIAVQVFFPNATPRYPPLKLVVPRSPTTTLKGAPDTPEYRIHGLVNGRYVEVWVDIRRPHPTQAQLRLAQRAVSAVRFK
jgi:hypothetical protein